MRAKITLNFIGKVLIGMADTTSNKFNSRIIIKRN